MKQKKAIKQNRQFLVKLMIKVLFLAILGKGNQLAAMLEFFIFCDI